jgi:integrase
MPTKKSCRMFHNSEETRDTPRLLYDRKEAARQLSLSVRSLDYLVANKKLEFRRIGKKVLITHASLVRFSQANPAKKVRLRKEAEGRKRYYSQEEYQRLLHAVGQRFPEHSAELIVSVHSGMRLSEQYTCAWSQVFLDKREIRLTKTKNGSHRTVQLNADAVAAIRSLQRPDQRSKDPVFPREGPTFDNRSWLNPCFEDAEIEGATWHTARHTFCSWLAEAGATAHEIMAAAGHKTLSVSARYTHPYPKHTQSVVDRISSGVIQKSLKPSEQPPCKKWHSL